MIMKKVFLLSLLVLVSATSLWAQKSKAEITFDKTVHNFGTFSEDKPIVKCEFTFTNTGTTPLQIVRAYATCGCTVPKYTKDPVQPGEKGVIHVTYNGYGTYPGTFAKYITINSNAKNSTVRLTIKGEMLAKEKQD